MTTEAGGRGAAAAAMTAVAGGLGGGMGAMGVLLGQGGLDPTLWDPAAAATADNQAKRKMNAKRGSSKFGDAVTTMGGWFGGPGNVDPEETHARLVRDGQIAPDSGELFADPLVTLGLRTPKANTLGSGSSTKVDMTAAEQALMKAAAELSASAAKLNSAGGFSTNVKG